MSTRKRVVTDEEGEAPEAKRPNTASAAATAAAVPEKTESQEEREKEEEEELEELALTSSDSEDSDMDEPLTKLKRADAKKRAVWIGILSLDIRDSEVFEVTDDKCPPDVWRALLTREFYLFDISDAKGWHKEFSEVRNESAVLDFLRGLSDADYNSFSMDASFTPAKDVNIVMQMFFMDGDQDK